MEQEIPEDKLNQLLEVLQKDTELQRQIENIMAHPTMPTEEKSRWCVYSTRARLAELKQELFPDDLNNE